MIAVLNLVLLTACGGGKSSRSTSGDGKNEKAGSSSDYTMISGEVENDNGNLVGSGSLVFNKSLGSTDAQKNFLISFQLEEINAYLTVHTFGDNQLKSGLDFEFKRTSEDTVTLKINGVKIDETIKASISESISISLDVHNNESPAHVIAEAGSQELYNGTKGGWTQGGGTFWGLTLNKAVVQTTQLSDAKHGH